MAGLMTKVNRRDSNINPEGRRSRPTQEGFAQQRASVFGRNARLPSLAGPLMSRQTGAALRNHIQGALRRSEPKSFIEKCQCWKVPYPVQTKQVVDYSKYGNKQSYTFIYNRCVQHELYCPVCDFFFHTINDYHFHLANNDQLKPIEKMIIKAKDKIKQIHFEKAQMAKVEDEVERHRSSVMMKSMSINRKTSNIGSLAALSKFQQLSKHHALGLYQKEKEEPKEEKRNTFTMDQKRRKYYDVEISGPELRNKKKELNRLRKELYDLQADMEDLGMKRKLARIRGSLRKDSLNIRKKL